MVSNKDFEALYHLKGMVNYLKSQNQDLITFIKLAELEIQNLHDEIVFLRFRLDVANYKSNKLKQYGSRKLFRIHEVKDYKTHNNIILRRKN